MTSKISFFNLCRENLKRRLWLLVLTTLTFFISMPLALMITLQNEVSYGITEQSMLRLFSSFFGVGFNSVLAGGFAIICAVGGFSWLFSKKKVDLYHSIPVKREKIFAACYLNGILLYLVPYLVSILLCLLIISRYLTITGSLFSLMAITFGVHLLFFLFFYNVMLIAVMATGNMFNCLLSGGVLFIYAIAVRALLEAYLSAFILTHYENFNFLEETRFTSPLLAMIYFMVKYIKSDHSVISYITGGSFALYLLQCAVLMVIAGAAALVLYKKRPSEAAGRSIAFSKILNAYRILLVIPLSLGCGIFMAVLVNTDSWLAETAWFSFGLLFGLVLSHGFIEVLFQMDIRGMFSYKKQLLATGVVVFLLAFSIRGDWYGINKSMPKEEKVSSMAVYMYGIDEGSMYINDPQGAIYNMDEYLLKYLELPTESVYKLAQRGRDFATSNERWEQADTACFAVKYRLKSGKEVCKEYWISAEEADSYMEEIYNLPEFKAVMRKRFEDAYIVDMYLYDAAYGSVTLDQTLIPEFVELYCNEYETLTLQKIKDSRVVAAISFEGMDREKNYRIRGNYIPIYAACEETLRFLEEHRVTDNLILGMPDADTVRSISLDIYDPGLYQEFTGREPEHYLYGSNGYFVTITDREEIEKLAPYLLPDISSSWIYETYSRVNAYVSLRDGETEYGFSAEILADAPLYEILDAHRERE